MSDKPPVYAWPQEAINAMIRLYLNGDSASQIATALGNGLTRNAVIGKLNRLRDKGLRPELSYHVISVKKARGQQFSRIAASKMMTPYRPQPKPAKVILFKAPTMPKLAPPPPPAAAPEPTGAHTAILANLRPRGCKWIVEDFLIGQGDTALMCGELRSGEHQYCEHHRRIGKTSWPDRRVEASNRGLRRLGVWATKNVYGS
jgi:GcrA cell cycle regulator